METTLQRHSKLAQYLYRALENGEFELYYQPIYDISQNKVFALEELLRWDNPVLGKVPTDQRLEVAEEMGILLDIEQWVLRTAIASIKPLQQCFNQQISVAVNISGQYFSDANFIPL